MGTIVAMSDLEALRHPLWIYLYHCCRNAADAEDMVQDVFIKYLAVVSSGTVIEDCRRWLFTAAKHVMIDRGRVARRQAAHASPITDRMPHIIPDDSRPLDDRVLRRQRARQLRDALLLMTPLQRRCIRLRAQGWMLREIAAELGTEPNRVAEALARAIPHLQRALDLPVTPAHQPPCRLRKAA